MSDAISEQTLLAMPASEYMSAVQRHFFRNRLLRLARDCEQEMDSARRTLRTPTQADPLDAAVDEEACRHQLRFLERRQGLLAKARAALRRLENGEYGYCRHSGEPIGLRRLLARPTTEYCAEVKARLEQNERHYQRTG
ncbi:MAG: TraR/DksA C4-type zinc finger protein [Pseudomonadales bacterium]|nr:TraR/DksA C4-type zinc finger protein [Pseudomonadales bacterium]